jgi:hypothetical protein
MPKETINKPNEGGLVRLKFTFKYGDKFVEPDDDCLKSIEAVSDELLGHTRRQKIPHYPQPSEAGRRKGSTEYLMPSGSCILTTVTKHGVKKRKDTVSTKEAASAALSEPAPKRKKIKVLTHRPRYIELATVPESSEK